MKQGDHIISAVDVFEFTGAHWSVVFRPGIFGVTLVGFHATGIEARLPCQGHVLATACADIEQRAAMNAGLAEEFEPATRAAHRAMHMLGLGLPGAFVVEAVLGGVIIAELLRRGQRVLLDKAAGLAEEDLERRAGLGVGVRHTAHPGMLA